MVVYLHAFFSSAINGSQRSASLSHQFNRGKKLQYLLNTKLGWALEQARAIRWRESFHASAEFGSLVPSKSSPIHKLPYTGEDTVRHGKILVFTSEWDKRPISRYTSWSSKYMLHLVLWLPTCNWNLTSHFDARRRHFHLTTPTNALRSVISIDEDSEYWWRFKYFVMGHCDVSKASTDPEYEGMVPSYSGSVIRNVEQYSSKDTASYLRRLQSAVAPL